MVDIEIPSDEEVVAVLRKLGGNVTAVRLCEALVERDHPILQSQIAIQRAADRKKILINRDWTLGLPIEAVAA